MKILAALLFAYCLLAAEVAGVPGEILHNDKGGGAAWLQQ